MTTNVIQADHEQLTTIQHIDLKGVDRFTCRSNLLKSLDFLNPSSLTYLDCSGNRLQELDVSPLVNLKTLNCYDNKLTSLIVGKLEYLYCATNYLTNINLPSTLEKLYIYENNIQEINNSLPNLILLDCTKCPFADANIIKLNFSLLPKLQRLDCDLKSLLGLILPRNLIINCDTAKAKERLVSMMHKEMKIDTHFDTVLEQYHNFLYLGSKMEESREKIIKLSE